jgi:hypothetical protein
MACPPDRPDAALSADSGSASARSASATRMRTGASWQPRWRATPDRSSDVRRARREDHQRAGRRSRAQTDIGGRLEPWRGLIPTPNTTARSC